MRAKQPEAADSVSERARAELLISLTFMVSYFNNSYCTRILSVLVSYLSSLITDRQRVSLTSYHMMKLVVSLSLASARGGTLVAHVIY